MMTKLFHAFVKASKYFAIASLGAGLATMYEYGIHEYTLTLPILSIIVFCTYLFLDCRLTRGLRESQADAK